ncbi:MAG: hypothetical protein OEY86_12425, partial [Nitrospira sp.]|nr:hypothetical protein [Nitrospira sp.]
QGKRRIARGVRPHEGRYRRKVVRSCATRLVCMDQPRDLFASIYAAAVILLFACCAISPTLLRRTGIEYVKVGNVYALRGRLLLLRGIIPHV